MNRKAHRSAVALAAAIVGLVAGYELALQRDNSHPSRAAKELQEIEGNVAVLHDEIDHQEQRLRDTRTESDTLLRSRWRLRTRLLHTRIAPARPDDKPAVDGPSVYSAIETTSPDQVLTLPANLVRTDDRLIAHLSLERHQNDRLKARYHALWQAYRDQEAVMQEHISLSRQIARKKRRRTVILTAAVATAAALVIASN